MNSIAIINSGIDLIIIVELDVQRILKEMYNLTM